MNLKIVIAVWLAGGAIAAAQEISRHNTQYIPVAKARALLVEAGCVRVSDPKQADPFRLVQNGDVYHVEGNRLTVSCAEWAETPPTVSAQLTWTAPTIREDGTPLAEADIDRYNITHNGDLYTTVSGGGTTWRIDGLVAGEHFFTVQAVATDGQVSDPTAPEWVTVQ